MFKPMQHQIFFKKTNFKNAEKSFLKFQNYFDSNSIYEIENIKIIFLGLDEPNYGRLILKVKILENNIDITNKICENGFCSPIGIDFIDFQNHLLYFPFDNYIVFYKIINKEVTKILFPNELKGLKYIYKVDNSLIILFSNGYIKINLENLAMIFSVIEKIDFVTFIEGIELAFIDNFTQILYNSQQFDSQIKISNLYDTTFSEYVEKSYIESQKGFLWINGYENIENEKILNENTWIIIGYSDSTKTLTIGTLLVINKGNFDESQRTMWFKTKNEYLNIELKKHFC